MRIRQRHAEFARERLRDEVHADHQTRAILLLRQKWPHRVANASRGGVGEKSFRAASRRDEDLARAGLACFLRDEQHDHAKILGWIAGCSLGPDAPLPADLERDVARGTITDVREGDDGDFSARLVPHFRDDRLHATDRCRIQHAGEIVDISARRRNGDLCEGDENGEKHLSRQLFGYRSRKNCTP